MKKNWFIRILALAAALLMLSVCAVAEEVVADRPLGDFPERGIALPMTQADVDAGISVTYMMGGHELFPTMPILYVSYADQEALFDLLSNYDETDLEENEDLVWEILLAAMEYNYTLYEIVLLDTAKLNELQTSGETLDTILGVPGLTVLTENDGYTYVAHNAGASIVLEGVEAQKRLAAAAARAKELLDGATYQPVVFAEGELTVAPDVFPIFETVDLNGNTVTNDIFYGKDLTVVNIWGTFCDACIGEMPELAEWSASMPENVQLIGLVSDLNSADDADTLELAQAICEATGADAYISLIANEDFAEMLSGVVGFPTTFFVDSLGMLVGEPIVGANVSGCKSTVEELLSAM